MSQVNVNTPGGEPAPPVSDGSGYGFIVGIIVAVVVIALLVWLLLFNNGGGNGGNNTNDNGGPQPTGYHLVHYS